MRRFARRTALLVLAFQIQMLGLPAWSAPAGTEPGTAAPVVPGSYRIASEDQLGISVINFPELSTSAVVLPDGTITLPLLGAVKVEGMTTSEIAAMLTKDWDEFVVRPAVTVAVTAKRSAFVLFNGFAARVGAIPFRPGMRITEALAEVGGAAPKGDLSKTSITRRTGEKMDLDLSHPDRVAQSEKDILLQEGDVVYIPELRTQVSVIGQVGRPGSYDYKEDMTVLDLLGMAGGVMENADLSMATIEKDGKEAPLDLHALLRQGDMTINQALGPDDRILIPEIQNRTYVFGAVAKPGFYPYKPGDRILDALDASGLAPHAELREVRLIQIDKTKNEAVVNKVDLEKFLREGKMEANAAIGPGDVIFIPDKKRGFHLSDALGIMSGISLIDNTIRILTGSRRFY